MFANSRILPPLDFHPNHNPQKSEMSSKGSRYHSPTLQSSWASGGRCSPQMKRSSTRRKRRWQRNATTMSFPNTKRRNRTRSTYDICKNSRQRWQRTAVVRACSQTKCKFSSDSQLDQAETSRKRQKLEQGVKDAGIAMAHNTRTASISSTGTASSVYMSSPIGGIGPHSSAIGRQPVSPIVLPSPGFQRNYRDTVLNDPRDEPDNFSLSSHEDSRHQQLPVGILHSSSSQTTHIQQQLSYARERPPPPRQPTGSSYLSYSRTPTPLVATSTSSISSMSSFDENTRSSRALPLPTPSISTSTPSYFDSRSNHPAHSLGSSSHMLSSSTNQLIHPSSYPPPIPSSTATQSIHPPHQSESPAPSGSSHPPSGVYQPPRAPPSQ